MKNCSECIYHSYNGASYPCVECDETGSRWVQFHKTGPMPVYNPADVAFNKRALDVQIAGNHYKDLAIQPVEYIYANNIGYFEGNVIKYVSRWRNKNGIKDLEKAKHYIELLIELEGKKHD